MTDKITLKSKRSGALDLFRFLAVLTVFLAHYTDTFNFRYNIVPENLKWSGITRYASISLIVFYMVSGYVITMTSVNRNFKDFAIARVSRLYPLFWISCITEFFLTRIIHDHTYLMHASLRGLLFNLTLIPQAFGYDMINPVYYTLITEFIFYIFIGFIIILKLWNRVLIIISGILIYCIVVSFNPTPSAGLVILPFLAGMLLYFIKAGYNNSWKLISLYLINYLCFLVSCVAVIKNPWASFKNTQPLDMGVIIVIVSIIYLVLYLVSTGKSIVKSSAITQILGEIAYPFYLFHLYFLFIYWYFSKTIQPDLLLAGILIIVVITSRLLNVWVEKPLSKLASRILYSITELFGNRKNKKTQLSNQEPPAL